MVNATMTRQTEVKMRSESYYFDRDLLIGGRAICDFINTLVDTAHPITPKMIYFWVEQNHIPARRIGARIVGSKTKIRAHLGAHSGDHADKRVSTLWPNGIVCPHCGQSVNKARSLVPGDFDVQ
jgi:hypothetical protein